jgi:hypothetical protein
LGLLVLVLLSVPSAGALTEDDVRDDLARAYESVVRAEAAGGYVAGMVSQLDDVARKLPDATPASLEAYNTMIDAVMVEAASAEVAGRQSGTIRLYEVVTVVMIIVVLGVLFWSRGSRWFWGAWLQAHRGWKVERI